MTANALWLGAGAILCVTAILAVAVWTVSARLEKQVRQQIVDRDAYALHSVFTMQLLAQMETGTAPWATRDPLNQLTAILETSRLKGVLAARLYSPAGKFLAAIPTNVRSNALDSTALRSVEQLRPFGSFDPQSRFSDLFEAEANHSTAPLVRVLVPIQGPSRAELDGIAEFILDGHPVAAEYATLSRRLSRYATVVVLIAAGVVASVVGWAVRRLGKVNRALTARTAELLRANEELTLAAKTSAIGSVAAHLVHGLRNPLAGLQNFVAARAPGGEPIDWALAADAAGRMRQLMDETLRVLAEEHAVTQYEITARELAELHHARMAPVAAQRTVVLEFSASTEVCLRNREANIVLLVLQNLVKNAIDSSPPGGRVTVDLSEDAGTLFCEINDDGPGLPEHVRENLFRPVRSTKADGTGIGLAICKQLAAHISAELVLKNTSRDGTAFVLKVPAKSEVLKIA